MSKAPPPLGYDDNPEWTDADIARAKPASEMHPPHVVAALVRNKGGRPAGSNKVQIALRADREVVERFKAEGPGWQTRMNEALRKAVGL